MAEILTKEEIDFFKQNQDQITQELLDSLRSKGNEGKRIALEILDMPKNERMYYLDAFGGQISYDGNRELKKPGVVMNLNQIHLDEIERCASDFAYFRDNYIRIKTPTGVNFPELRDYQNRFIDVLLQDDVEQVVGLMGRQCVDGETMLDLEDRNLSIKELFEES